MVNYSDDLKPSDGGENRAKGVDSKNCDGEDVSTVPPTNAQRRTDNLALIDGADRPHNNPLSRRRPIQEPRRIGLPLSKENRPRLSMVHR